MKKDFSSEYIESFEYYINKAKLLTERNEMNIIPDVTGDVKQTAKNVTVVLVDDKNSIKFTGNVNPNQVHVLTTTDPASKKTKTQFYVGPEDIYEVLINLIHNHASGKMLYGKNLSDVESIQIVDSAPEPLKINKASGEKINGNFYVFDDKHEFKIKEPINNNTLKLVYIPRAKRTV